MSQRTFDLLPPHLQREHLESVLNYYESHTMTPRKFSDLKCILLACIQQCQSKHMLVALLRTYLL